MGAFAAVGAVEGAWAKEKGQLYRLSEQELIDCDKSDGGCNGGGISSALTWVHNHHGLAKNADYGVGHYHPSEGNCHQGGGDGSKSHKSSPCGVQKRSRSK